MSSLSLIPEEKIKMFPNSSKSTESLYSSSSSKYSSSGLYRRKAAARQAGLIPATNEVRQRVLSARRLRMKTLQNQLVDAQQHLAELANENRILRTLHKRQDSALSKYESTNAELPQLLHSHAEEIRIWQTKYRNLMAQNKELANKLKQKDGIILGLSDQNKHLTQLNKDKNLEERERLAERVRYLESRILEKDNDLKLLARRLQLESKSFKHQLHNEHSRYKDVILKLERTKSELANFGQVDVGEAIEKLPKTNLIHRSLSGSRMKNKSDDTQPLYMPQSELALLPRHSITNNKPTIDKSHHSPKPEKDNQRASAPTTRRPSFMGRMHRRRNSQKDELTEAIKKGMSALNADYSLSEEDEDQNRILEKRIAEKHQEKREYDFDEIYDDVDDDDDDCRSDEDDDTADVIIGTEGKREDDFEEVRKQMSKDYKEQDSVLDSFCKDSSADGEKELSNKSSNLDVISKRGNIDPKKKVKLLAALKAIDEDKGEEDK